MEWIQKQVESILSQKKISITIFISVDVSTDDTYLWCKKLSIRNKCIKVLPYGKKFGMASRNFFYLIRNVNFSQFDYVALADQDDIWHKNKLYHAIKSINKECLDGFSSNVTAFWGNGRKKLVKKSYPQKKFDYFFESAGPGCTYVLTKDSIQKFKKFLVSNWIEVSSVEFHDWIIYAFYRSQGLTWKIDEKPLILYRQHNNNYLGFNSGLKAYLRRFSKIKMKWYRNEVNRIIKLVSKNSKVDISLEQFFLIKNFWQLRRRPRDLFILFFLTTLRIF